MVLSTPERKQFVRSKVNVLTPPPLRSRAEDEKKNGGLGRWNARAVKGAGSAARRPRGVLGAGHAWEHDCRSGDRLGILRPRGAKTVEKRPCFRNREGPERRLRPRKKRTERKIFRQQEKGPETGVTTNETDGASGLRRTPP